MEFFSLMKAVARPWSNKDKERGNAEGWRSGRETYHIARSSSAADTVNIIVNVVGHYDRVINEIERHKNATKEIEQVKSSTTLHKSFMCNALS